MEFWAYIPTVLTFAMYWFWIPNTKFKPTLEDFSVAGDGLGRSKKKSNKSPSLMHCIL